MAHRGRPKDECEKVVIHVVLTLKKGQDDDLIDFCCKQAPRQRANAIKMALRAGGMGTTCTLVEEIDDDEIDMDEFVY